MQKSIIIDFRLGSKYASEFIFELYFHYYKICDLLMMNCFCGMADLRTVDSRICRRDHHQEVSPSWLVTSQHTEVGSNLHFVKFVHIRTFSGPYFLAFGLHMEICGVNFRIQSKYGKIWTKKTPNTATFYAVPAWL